jgi:tetratricopeptide (TPR) repeat protein
MSPTAASESSARLTLGVSAIVLLVIFGLWTIDVYLAKTERAEVQAEASSFYLEGTGLLEKGQAAEAVEVLRRAYTAVRDDRRYQMQLAVALIADSKTGEAEALLGDVLQKNSTYGQANLLMARLMVKKGDLAAAESYYHRAIYGIWSGDAASHQIQTRLELIDLLERRHASKEMLAETLPLEGQTDGNPTLQKQIANLYIVAGSPARAISVYHALLLGNSKDSEAYKGLGEAELSIGDYHQAQSAFLNALRVNPEDSEARKRLELASSMTALDPTPRRLSSKEKYARSMRILELVRNAYQACGQSGDLLEAANAALSAKAQPPFTNELAEQQLSLAEKLWKARHASCEPGDERLRLIMEKLAQ